MTMKHDSRWVLVVEVSKASERKNSFFLVWPEIRFSISFWIFPPEVFSRLLRSSGVAFSVPSGTIYCFF